jgi:hypothetical protein
MDDTVVKAKMRRVDPAGPYAKWTCSLCGGRQSDGPWVVVEAAVEDLSVLVCGDCIEWSGEHPRCIDDGLEEAAAKADRHAELFRSLVGRLRVPTYAQWRAADGAAERAWKDAHERKQAAEERARAAIEAELKAKAEEKAKARMVLFGSLSLH